MNIILVTGANARARTITLDWRRSPRRRVAEGIDFPAETGTTVGASASSKVVFADAIPPYGKMVEVDQGNGLTTRYAHASKLNVKAGDLVERGQRVATVDTTGRSSGPHLRFEVRPSGVPRNPARFLQATG